MAKSKIGQKSPTGYRGQSVRTLGDVGLTLGLNTITRPSAGQVNFAIPDPVVPQSTPLTSLADSLSSINTKLKQYQQSNAQKYKTQADLEVQRVIDERIAAGDTYDQIYNDFHSGKYDDTLKQQMHYDSFNTAFGARAWNKFAQVEGKKITDNLMNTVRNGAWEDITELQPEVELASISNKFREKYGGQNFKLLAGAEDEMSRWRTETREAYNKAYNIRFNDERENVIADNGLTILKSSIDLAPEIIEVDLETKKTRQFGKKDPEAQAQKLENFPQTFNNYLKLAQKNQGVPNSRLRSIRLKSAQAIYTDAITDPSIDDNKRMVMLDAAYRLLTTSPEKGIPAPHLDFSTLTKNDGTAGQETATVANRIIKDITKAQEGVQTKNAVEIVAYQINNGQYVPEESQKYIGAANELLVKQVSEKYKNSPIQLTRKLAEIGAKSPQPIDFIKQKLNYNLADISEALKDKDRREATIKRLYETALMYNALGRAGAVDKYLPVGSTNRRMLDYLVMGNRVDLESGVPEQGLRVDDKGVVRSEGFGRSLDRLFNIIQQHGFRLPAGKQLSDTDNKKVYDGLEVRDSQEGLRSMFDTDIARGQRLRLDAEVQILARRFNMLGIGTDAAVKRIREHIENNFRAIGSDHIFQINTTGFANDRSPFLNPEYETEAAEYVLNQLALAGEKYAQQIRNDSFTPEDLTIEADSVGSNTYRIVYKGTQLSPGAYEGERPTITVSLENVQKFIADKRVNN